MKTAVSPQFLLKLFPSGLIGAAAVLLLLLAEVAAAVQHGPPVRMPEQSSFSAAGDLRSSEKAAELESSRAHNQLRAAARRPGKSNSPLSTSRPPQLTELLTRLHFHFLATDLPLRPPWRSETAALRMALGRAIPARAGPIFAA